MHGWLICNANQDWEINHELGSVYWSYVFCRMADTHLHLLCSKLMGFLVGWRDHVPDWNLARFLSLVPLTMDEDTKLILDAWRGLLVENAQLQRQVQILEEELRELRDVRERIDVDRFDVDWRRVGRGRRRNADSND